MKRSAMPLDVALIAIACPAPDDNRGRASFTFTLGPFMRCPQCLLIGLLTAAACSSPDDSSGDMHLVLVEAPETALPGSPVAHTLLVKVVNGDGISVPGIPVLWSIRSGGGRLSASADTSGVDGLAAARWTPGPVASPQQIGVSIYDQPAMTITVAPDAFRADRVDAGYRGVCGLQGTATWCWVYRRNNDQTFRILSQVQAKALALSDSYACVVDTAGLTYCYRYESYGGSLDPDAYQTVTGLPPIDTIASGDNYFCGLAVADNTPWCWTGAPFFGAVQVSPTLRLTSIAAGNYVGCGLDEDGAAWCWDSFDPPAAVPGGHAFRQIAVGAYTACAIEAPARLYCWDRGQAPVSLPGASPAAIAMGLLSPPGVHHARCGSADGRIDGLGIGANGRGGADHRYRDCRCGVRRQERATARPVARRCGDRKLRHRARF